MGKEGRARRRGGGRDGGARTGKGGGRGGQDTGGEETEGVRLIDVARAMRMSLLKKYGKAAKPDPGYPEGMMLSDDWVSVMYSYSGKTRKISLPRILLLRTSRSFQIGYIYSALARAIKPTIRPCPDCGRMCEQEYGFSGGAIYKIGEAHG